MRSALQQHWREYVCEAAGLGRLMLAAAAFATLLEHPTSPLRQTIADPHLRRVPMGLAMGLTTVALIYSPLGQRSGAHLNPAVTATFYRLGKVAPADAAGYVVAQFVGAIAGLALAAVVLREWLGHPAVDYVKTIPGDFGVGAAFAAEALISFGLMLVVLVVSNTPRIARWTGLCAGALVATYIVVEAPLSGMSMNPARTLASAVFALDATALWLYFAAPLAGTLLAAEAYRRLAAFRPPICAKLAHPPGGGACIFRHCGYQQAAAVGGVAAGVTDGRPTETIAPM